MKIYYKYNALIILLLTLPIIAQSQLLESNYWNYNYGTKAQILSGAILGGCDDKSSIFYNPAFIGIDSTRGFSMSLFSPTISRIESRSDQLNNENYNTYSILPNIVIIDFSIFKNPNLASSFAIFERAKANVKILSNLSNPINSNKEFKGFVDYRNKIAERLYAAGFSYKFNESLRVGFTEFLSSRNQLQIYDTYGSVITNKSSLLESSISTFKEVEIAKLALFTKFGLFWQDNIFSTGLTLTTPEYLTIHTSSSLAYLRSLTVDQELVREETEAGTKYKVVYKTPWSLGYGLNFSPFHNAILYFTIEHFFGIEDYSILTNNLDKAVKVLDGKRTVTNYAIAFESHIYKDFKLLAGFRTNYNNRSEHYDEDPNSYLNKLVWDVYHVSAGGYFNINSFRFSAGVEYSFSDNHQNRILNPYNDLYNQLNIYQDSPNALEASAYRGYTLFLNYSLLLGEINNKK